MKYFVDILSVNGSTRASVSDIASIRELNFKECNGVVPCPCDCGEIHTANVVKHDGNGKAPVYVDELSIVSVDASGGKDGSGVLLDHCLPCIPSSVSASDRKGAFSPGQQASKKRLSFKLSFKSRDVQAQASLPLCKSPFHIYHVPSEFDLN